MAALIVERLAAPAAVLAGALVLGTTIGTPYLQLRAACHLDTTGNRRCVPPAECVYLGLQGRRWLFFNDAIRCPAIVLMPWAVAG